VPSVAGWYGALGVEIGGDPDVVLVDLVDGRLLGG